MDLVRKWEIVFDSEKNKYKSLKSKKYLMSYSNLTNGITKLQLLYVPTETIDRCCEFGKEMMENWQNIITKKLPIETLTPYWQKIIVDGLNTIKATDPHIRIYECEKCVADGNKIGFLDLYGKAINSNIKTIIEIKTSSDWKIKNGWLNQLAYYRNILKSNNFKRVEHYIMIFNKKVEEWRMFKIQAIELNARMKKIKEFMEIF